jgi:hypothetical protein
MREDRDKLAQRYRRLLVAYPREYRQARGDELLETLLAATPPGRRNPTVRAATSLLRHGLRAQLGRPGSRAVVVAAALTAVLVGFLGAAGCARLAWQGARDLPDDSRAAAITQVALPDAAPASMRRNDGLFFYDDPTNAWTPVFGADDYSPGRVEYLFNATSATGDHRAFAEAATDRFRSAGWQVGEVRVGDGQNYGVGSTFWARKNGLTVELADEVDVTPSVNLTIVRTEPWWVLPAAVLGGLAGMLAGWLLAGWVSRRTAGRHPAFQVGAGLFWVAAIVGMLPSFALSVLLEVNSYRFPAPWMPLPSWFGLVYLGRLPALLAGLAGLVVVGLAALPRRLPARRPVDA